VISFTKPLGSRSDLMTVAVGLSPNGVKLRPRTTALQRLRRDDLRPLFANLTSLALKRTAKVRSSLRDEDGNPGLDVKGPS
jgi:hypothetical protein